MADLGIAHVNPDFVTVGLQTIESERLLNRDYYAPEQRFGKATAVDHRADIYALGCIFYEMLTYPITRRQLLIGKVCFNVCLSLIGALLSISVGVLMLNVPVRWEYLPVTALVILVTTAGWFFLLSIFAIRLHRMDSFNTVTSAAYIFLMFLSSMFYPLTDLPAWFQWTARVNPMTWQVDMLRFGLLGTGAPTVILLESVAFAVFTLVCLALAVRALDAAA